MDVIYYLGALLPVTVCGITDLQKKIVPNIVTLPAIVAGLAYHALFGQGVYFPILGGLAGFIVMYVGFRLGGVGGGDVKLVTALGAWFGYLDLYWIILVASAAGVFWGFALRLKRRDLASEAAGPRLRLRKLPDEGSPPPDAVPFGACLALATWIVVAGKVF